MNIENKLKNNRKLLQAFKKAALTNKEYKLGADLRELEVEHFPAAKQTDAEYKKGQDFRRVLNMVELSSDDKTAYILLRVLEAFKKMGKDFDLRTAAKINSKAEQIFGG